MKIKGIIFIFGVVIALAVIATTSKILASHFNFDLSHLREEIDDHNLPSRTLAYERIKIEDAWNFIKTENPPLQEIIVGIIDTGINQNHPEFSGVNLGRTPTDLFTDPELHGTLVAGIVGANNLSATSSANYQFPQMNGIISGVTSTYIMGLRGFDERPEIIEAAFNDLIAGQADTINMSWGFTEGGRITNRAFQELTQFFQEYFDDHGETLFVKSAGNLGINVASNTPANIPADNLIVVGATNDVNDGRAIFTIGSSNFGNNVALSAPGVNVYGPAGFTEGEELELDNYRQGNGTSFAAPMVTGVAAILKSIKPEFTPAEIKDILIRTADPIQTGEPDKRLGTGCYSDPNDPINTGCRLNALKAIQELLIPPPPPPTATIWPQFQHA